jgi:hypothetical protein
MKFSDIIKSNSWLSVELVFIQLYPDEKDSITGYEKVFNNLRIMEPVKSDITILVKNAFDDFDKNEYVDVSGYKKNEIRSTNDLNDSLALEFTPWEKWLGMDLDDDSLNDFSELEIICHCLYEMTFFSFDQKEIKKELTRINDIVDEIDNMTEEEKKEKLIPFDEVKKKFKNTRSTNNNS